MVATVPLVRVRSAPTTETVPEALTLTRSERSPIAALVTDLLEEV